MTPPPEPNARLILELMQEHGCIGFEPTGAFFELYDSWHCPVCCRSKREIARKNKNGELLVRIVYHHDHFENIAARKLQSVEPYAKRAAMIASLRRFDPIQVCGDCNNADTAAKTAVRTPSDFSFAPFEIAAFILPLPNRAHSIDEKVAAQVYELARVQMRNITARMKSLAAAL